MALTLDVGLKRRTMQVSAALEVQAGETVALVGPSGAGKTTLLRCVAGLDHPDEGSVVLDGETWCDTAQGTNLAPQQRSVGFVFQDYALFPHLDVRRNVAFGGPARVDELLRRLRIEGLAKARPAAISGGERQRVALARALARDPKALLLDEPLSALDTDTRSHVRDELTELLGELGLPTLLVTHDSRDAFALADRVGVMVQGRLRQIGTPQQLIENPADGFVARFCGSNLLTGTGDGNGSVRLDDSAGTIKLAAAAAGPVAVAIAPWQVKAGPAGSAPPGAPALTARLTEVTSESGRTRLRIGPLVALCEPDAVAGLQRGAEADAWFAADDARLVEPQG